MWGNRINVGVPGDDGGKTVDPGIRQMSPRALLLPVMSIMREAIKISMQIYANNSLLEADT